MYASSNSRTDYVPKVYFAVWNGFQDARANWKEQYFDEVAETLVVHAYV